LLDAAAIRQGSRVLDVATGAGYIAAVAAQRGADPVGIDISAEQVRMARVRYPTVRFEQADAEALPFDSHTFDAVVNGFGMCHFPNPDIALREAFRVLKRGGRVAFTVWDTPERAVAVGALYAAVRAHGSMDVGLPPVRTSFCSAIPSGAQKHY
jgi:ubiquinone/menaquinone biosynthesis C-methylase UbiE